jgi:RHS repeat-associated protein
MTTSAETFNSGTTAYTYDLGDRLTTITPPASMAGAQSFTLDALGRIATETVGSTTTTLSYVGTSKTVSRLATGATNVDSLLSSDGSRLATASGASFGWLTPDLHGDIAGASNSSFGTITDALRYDAFGTISAATTSALPTPWRYQGQLLVSPAGASDLYAAGARFYAPGLGAFTQLDTSQGGALNPLSMNRFVYAEANPETFTDPSGHTTILVDDAYGTTITTDATHKHYVHQQVTAAQLKAYKALDWEKIYAERAIERRAQLASDRFNRLSASRDRDSAATAAGPISQAIGPGIPTSDRMGDNGPPSLDGLDVNGNPISGMCKTEVDVASCDSALTVPPVINITAASVSSTTHDVLANVSSASQNAGILLLATSFILSPQPEVAGPVALAGGALMTLSQTTGVGATVMDCSGNDLGACVRGIGEFEIDRFVQGAAMFKDVAAAGKDLVSGAFSTVWDALPWNWATPH